MNRQRFKKISTYAILVIAGIIFTLMSMEIISLQNSAQRQSNDIYDIKKHQENVQSDDLSNKNASSDSDSSTTDFTTAKKEQFNQVSMTPDEFTNMKIESKQFSKYSHDFPCLPKSNYEPGTGVHYIKVFKTASSTVAHIVKYIADKRGKCKEFSKHAAAHEFKDLHGRRKSNQPKSFLFTFVREPTKRAVSDFFYSRVSQAGIEVNLANFKEGCCRPNIHLNGQAGFQLAYITTDKLLPEYTFWNESNPDMVQRPYLLKERVNNVFDSYDFIGVSDRLNESLVTLSFLLDLDITEISYISYRESGSYEEVNQKCIILKPSAPTPDIQEYLKTDEWKAIVAGDKLLHITANDALDNTINNVIGRDHFEERLKEYEALITFMKACEEECSSSCTKDGKYRGETSCRPCMNEHRQKWKDQRMS